MDKVALLPSSSHRDADLSNVPTASNILNQLAPAITYAVHVHRILSSVSTFVCLRAYFLASVTLYASKIVAVHTWFATKFGAIMSGKILYSAWESTPVRAIRKKVFDEFAEFIMGSGNVVFLMLFWPGWLVLGGTTYALWKVWG